MAFFSWSHWLRRLRRPRVRPIRTATVTATVRPRLEQLECRLAPATFTWTGLGGDNLWSDAANWNSPGGGAPSGSASSLDDLVFQGNKQVTTKNDLVGATFNSITISSPNFDLTGLPITLGSTAPLGSGKIIVNGGSTADVIDLDLQLGGAGSAGQQVLDIGVGSNLTINGALISATAGVGLTKVSTGTLTLTHDNSAFTGAFTISAGVVDITNANALGTSTSGSNQTTVQSGAQLQFSGVGTVTENFRLNGLGLSSSGAVRALSGNTILKGQVILDSDVFFGADTGATLEIDGTITDLGNGHNVSKEGDGTVIFANANTYHGSTTVDNGILQIRNGQALGVTDGSAKTGVTVNYNNTGPTLGTLELNDPTGVGFTVTNVLLTLNGDGFGYTGGPHPGTGIGALDSLNGNNTWTGGVILGTQGTTATTVAIRVQTGTAELASTLTLTGVIQDPKAGAPPIATLYKIGLGTLDLTNSNTYSAATEIDFGILEINDSQSLGPVSKLNGTTVLSGGTLELAVDNIPDSLAPNNTFQLNVSTPLILNGTGNNNVGALYSATGINTYLGSVTFASNASIGVDPDPNPTADPTYFTADYSLTLPGGLNGGGDMQKVGGGQLILPNASAGYTRDVDIRQGWITVENNLALGGRRAGLDQNRQPIITIDDGASLHLFPPPSKSLTLTDNFTVYGDGISHPFSMLNREGAILSLDGANTISGNVLLGGLTGIGSQLVHPSQYAAGQLYFTGLVSETPALLRASGAGNSNPGVKPTDEVDFPIATGATGGQLSILANSLGFGDDFRVYLGGDKNTGILVYDSSLQPYPANAPTSVYTASIVINYTSTSATITVTPFGLGAGWNGGFVNGAGVINYTALTSTDIEIVVDQVVAGTGNNDGSTKWTMDALDTPTVSHGTLVKLGQQLVGMQGPGTYHGGADIREGVLVDQNATGLGTGPAPGTGSTITVESGATLAIANVLAGQNGGIATGYATWGDNLILNGPGNTSLLVPNGTTAGGGFLQTSAPLAPFMVLGNDNLMDGAPGITGRPSFDSVIPADFLWTGTVSLNTSVAIDVEAQARMNFTGSIDDAGNAAPAGSDFIKVDSGELVLSGVSTYRGSTYIGTSATAGTPGFNPDGINDFLNGGAAIAGGVVTAASNQAFGANTGGGVIVQNGSSLQLEGNITIAGKSLTVQGTGVPTVGATENWMEQGPASIGNGQTLGANPAPVSGRVTDLAVDPNDPLTMYLATGGGGLWKTTDGAATWHPIWDTAPTMFFGTVAVDPLNSQRIYASTGYMDNASDSEIGTGVYRSNDGGATWSLLLNANGSNPLYGLTVTDIAFDTGNPNFIYDTGDPDNSGLTGSVLYVTTSDQAINKPNAYVAPAAPPVPGVYRWDSTPPAGSTRWFNLTDQVSVNRAGGSQVMPIQPGPEDDFRIDFAQSNNTWSSLTITNGVLFAAQGADQGYPARPLPTDLGASLPSDFHAPANALFRLPLNQEFYTTPATRGQLLVNFQGGDYSPSFGYAGTVWFIGNGEIDPNPTSSSYGTVVNSDSEASNPPEFLTPILQAGTADNGFIAVTAVTTGANVFQQTIYAAIAYPDNYTPYPGYQPDQFFRILESTDGGFTWSVVNAPPVNYFGNEGDYSNVIYTPDGTTVYIGGQNNFLKTTNSGAAWTDITVDGANNGPYANFHTITPEASGNIIVTTDGGIWRLDTAKTSWTDLNGDPADNNSLANSLVSGVGVNFNNPQLYYDGNQAGGIAQFNDLLSWSQIDGNIINTPYGGQVLVDPNDPNTLYAVITNIAKPGGAAGLGLSAILQKSTDGGKTWNTINGRGTQNPPFLLDPLNPDRVLLGGGALEQSMNGGATWVNVNSPVGVTAMAIAGYQGVFVPDPFFPLVNDKGTSKDDPNTIYVTDGFNIEVTKDNGNTWVQRNLPGFLGAVRDLVVDPRNRDTVYAVRASTDGKQLWVSTNAARTWSQVTSAGLPNVIAYKMALNPQTDDLYVANARGVSVLYNGAAAWTSLGTGLPTNLQVKSLTLNPYLNTLTIGTYGRSTYVMWLNESQAAGGDRTTMSPASGAAITVLAGTAVWTGPVTLSGAITVAADGGATYQRFGNFTGQLNVVGSIGDIGATPNQITKVGLGNVILSGKNTYAGETDVQQGVLIVDNPDALSGSFTLVENFAALQLESSISNNEPLTLNGDGPAGGFDGHFTGSLESIANNNTYTGPITLASNATIGVDSGSVLTITGAIGEQASGLNLTKELTGTLILDDTNSYSGSTYVNQGIMQLQSSGALAGGGSSTVYVLDGAQIQLESPDGGTGVTVANPLNLSGTGITGTGALLNVSGDNTWSGDIVLDANPGFALNTLASGAVAFGVGMPGGTYDPQDILRVSGAISEARPGMYSGLRKVGPDTLVLSGTNTFTGTTYVDTGRVTIQNPKSLGTTNTDDVQRLTVYDPAGTGTLSLQFGTQTMASAISATSSAAAWQTAIQKIVQAFYATGGVPDASDTVSVQLDKVSAPLVAGTPTPSFLEFVYTVVFHLPDQIGKVVPLLVPLPNTTATASVTAVAENSDGTNVADGAALALDLDPTSSGAKTTVSGETLYLNGAGINNTGALDNLSGDNTWAGAPITLNTTSDVGVEGGSLTVTGDVLGLSPAALIKVDTGTLFFPTANDYQGTTFVQNGILNIADPKSLGTGLTNAVQSLTITGATTGSFRVKFNGQQTADVLATASAADLQVALDALPAIGTTQTITNATESGTTVTITTSAPLGVVVGDQVAISGIGTPGYNGTFPVTSVVGNTFTYTAASSGLATDTNGGTAGAGNVSVTLSANIFTITFVGALGGKHQNMITASASSGTFATPGFVIDGGLGGTTVLAGGTLQLQGSAGAGLTVPSSQLETLTLNGDGYLGRGALDSIPGGTATAGNVWDNPIVLASNSSIGVTSDPSAGTPGLTIDQPISESAASTLTKVGVGSLLFNGTASNTYSGLTTVADGKLELGMTGAGTIDIPADLQVGDGTGAAASAILQLEQTNQFSANAIVTVLEDGLFDGNGKPAVIGTLNITDGTAQPGDFASGALTINQTTMVGGTITTNSLGSVTLGGDVTATSDGNQIATITGSGKFNLGAADRTFTVNLGAKSADLDVTLPIRGSVNFTKTGDGRMALDADSTATFTGTPTVALGELQVDGPNGKLGDVVLAGGTISGTGKNQTSLGGQVADIVGAAGAIPDGTIDPGDNGALDASNNPNPTGILTTAPGKTEVWGSSAGGPTTTLWIDMTDAANHHGAGMKAGTDYDQLVVNGNLNLGGVGVGANNGGALLSGTVGSNVAIGDTFTIITATGAGHTITGRFAEPWGEESNGDGIAFVGGAKFDVQYNSTSVVLTRVRESTTIAITSSQSANADTSVYGQNITFTSTMVAENGNGSLPAGDTVTFTLYTTDTSSAVLATKQVAMDSSGNAVFDPQNLVPFTALTGTHEVTVSFDGDANFNNPSPNLATLNWTVAQADSSIVLSPNASTAVLGQGVPITVNVTAVSPGGQTPLFSPPGSPNPNVVLQIDPGTANAFTQTASLDTTGQVVVTLSTLGLGTHHIQATYGGDPEYNSSVTASTINVTVKKDDTSLTILANPTSPGTVGSPVSFTARLTTNAPGTATPQAGDTISFFDGSALLGGAAVSLNPSTGFYEATFTTSASALAVGSHNIKATFGGDVDLNASNNTIVYKIDPIATSTALSASVNPAILNQQVLLTATVTAPGGANAGTISGSVGFYDASVSPSKLLGTATVSSSGQAQFTINSLTIGTHPITAVYAGVTNYGTSTSNTVNEVIDYSSVTTLTSATNPATAGQNVDFKANVARDPSMPAAAGIPGGVVDFFVDGSATSAKTVTVDGAGNAVYSTAGLAVGTHTVVAVYTPAAGSSFDGSTSSALTETVLSVTTTTLTADANPAGLGNTFTLTAAIANTSAGAPTSFAGTVTFTDFFGGNTVTLGTVNVDPATGLATLPLNNLALGTHAITAAYSGDVSNLEAASTSSVLNEVIEYAADATVDSSLNPSPLGTNITFTATVTPASGVPAAAGNPTGQVDFYDGATLLGSGTLSGSTATFTTTTPLALGTHQITATYDGNANFAPVTSAALVQVVLSVSATALTADINPSAFAQKVTFTATVTDASTSSPVPGGVVTFMDGSVSLGTGNVNGSGVATYSTTSLSVATHPITAVYTTDTTTGYYTSTSPELDQVVNADGTNTALKADIKPSVFAQKVTFTATVTGATTGDLVTSGTVLFMDGATQIGSGDLDSSGQTTFSTTSLSVATHHITAVFQTTTDYTTSTSAVLDQVVNADDTQTALKSSLNPSVFGQGITFTATVTGATTGDLVTSGTVAFMDGATQIGTGSLNSSGQATFSTSTLSVTTHHITAVFQTTTDDNTSTSTQVDQVVNADDTTTTLASSANPSVFTESVIFTAVVKAKTTGNAVASGTVTFFDGSTQIGTGSLDSSGTATFTTTTLSVGTHDISASFGATTDYNTSTSATVSQEVDADDTTTDVKTSQTPAVFSAPVTFTVTVTANNPGGGPADGTVTLTDTTTNTQLATGLALDNTGTVTFTTNSLTVGSHAIVASYDGTSSFNASDSSALSQVISADSTSTALDSSTNPSVFGQAVTFTATVTADSPGTGTPAGVVTFVDTTTGNVLGSNVPLDASGQATVTVSNLDGGNHAITASYTATTDFKASTSTAVNQVVNADGSNTSLQTTVNPSVFGQSVTFTATVTAATAGNVVTSGTVDFFDGNAKIGSGTVDATGQATFTTGTLSVATHPITATFSGTADYTGSDSNEVDQVVNASATDTKVASAINPSVFAQSVTFTATVTATNPGTGVPAGTVTFYDGNTALGTGKLDGSGNATFATSALAVGSHAISAVYGGTTQYGTSTSAAINQVVDRDDSKTALSANPASSSVYTQSVTFTATVTGATTGALATVGTVTFFDGNTQIGTADVDSSGKASIATSSLGSGMHQITAQYAVSTDFNASTSAALSFMVNGSPTKTSLTSDTNPSVYTQSITFTAAVVADKPGSGPVTSGTVAFFDGSTQIGTGSLDSTGHATFSTTALTVGTHQVTASFQASASFATSTSTAVPQVVKQAPTTTTLSTTATPVSGSTYSAVYSEPVSFTAVVDAAPGTGFPAGMVNFMDGTTVLAAVPVTLNPTANDFEATFSSSTLPVATHPISAVFSPTVPANFGTSKSATLTLNVATDGTSVAVTSSANPALVKKPFTLTATVTADAPGVGTPTGTATFVDQTSGATLAANVPLDASGQASVFLPKLPFGIHNIVVTYSPTGGYSPSTGTLEQDVFYASKTRLTAAPRGAFQGAPVTFTATLLRGSGAPSRHPRPQTGTVTFYDGDTVLGTSPVSGGKAVFTTSSLVIGTHAITAHYSGDGTWYAPSVSAVVTETIFDVPASISADLVPGGSSQGFTVVAQLFDADGNAITAARGRATISLISGPGTFTPHTALYVGGQFTFSNLKVSAGGFYQLLIKYGGVETELDLTNSGGRLT